MIAKAKISATAVAVAVAAASSAPRRSPVRMGVRGGMPTELQPVRNIPRGNSLTVLKKSKSRKPLAVAKLADRENTSLKPARRKALPVESPLKFNKNAVAGKPMAVSGTAHPPAEAPVNAPKLRAPAVVRSIDSVLRASHATRGLRSLPPEARVESIDARFEEALFDAAQESGELETLAEPFPDDFPALAVEIPEVVPEVVLDEKAARKQALKQRAAEIASQQKDPVLARRDQVVLEHLPLVKAIAVRVHENLPVHVDLDDLVHAGVLGLFDAASKFNPEKQVAFSSYAKHRIKGAILDSLRQLDWASRDMRRRHKQLEAATRDLAATLQRNPTEAEIAEKLGMDAERWRNMMLDLRNVGLISASTRANENEDLPAPDFPTKPETHPDAICSLEQLRGVLGVAIKTLPERYQKVVSLYYSAEMTMKEIGGVLGINESRVSQIHKSALEKMQVVLSGNGITSAQAF